jgi:hypothetical protein
MWAVGTEKSCRLPAVTCSAGCASLLFVVVVSQIDHGSARRQHIYPIDAERRIVSRTLDHEGYTVTVGYTLAKSRFAWSRLE